MPTSKNAPTPVNSTNSGKIIINQPCAISRVGLPPIVTPRRRVVQGGRWHVENGRRVYSVNTRWEVEWVSVWTDWHGVTHIVARTEAVSEWELQRGGARKAQVAA